MESLLKNAQELSDLFGCCPSLPGVVNCRASLLRAIAFGDEKKLYSSLKYARQYEKMARQFLRIQEEENGLV